MNEDFTLNLLAGGCADCGPTWKSHHPAYDQCYKIYLPVEGRAQVSDGMGSHDLRPGFLYFISGYQLRSQQCPDGMRVHWVHFTPASFYIHRYLLRAPCVHVWAVDDIPWATTVMKTISALFENPNSLEVSNLHLDTKAPLSLTCRLEAVILYLVSDLLEAYAPANGNPAPELERLRRVIQHMDAFYLEDPPLANLAELANMAPNAFHRLFRKLLGMTPFHYMQAKRLDQARRLLVDPNKPIKEVAALCGYADPLYFSRVFSRHFGVGPMVAKKSFSQRP